MNSKKEKLFICLYRFIFGKIAKKTRLNRHKIIPFVKDNDNIPKTYHDIEYYNLIKNIRNCKVLSRMEFLFVETLPKKNLIELIEIYDELVKMFNEVVDGLDLKK